MKKSKIKFYSGLSLLGLSGLLSKVNGADAAVANTAATGWQKPAWLTDLVMGAKESYDDNLFGVSGKGMTPKPSWITTVSPKIGFNFAPLLGDQKTVQTLSLSYAPDFNIYHGAPSQSFNAHKIGDTIKGKSGDFSFALDNAFLFNDGSHHAPIYGVLGGPGGTSLDKYRSVPGMGASRERLAQLQDRATVLLQYDWNKIFIRPTASLLYYDLDSDLHNSSAIPGSPAPIPGYQNYADRYDVNGGVDLGFKLTPKLAATLGYRYGSQYQQQFPHSVDTDRHYSSNEYQRALLGLEGKPWSWLNVKLAGGPDFRSYNSMSAVNDFNPVTYYGEAVLTATLTPSQTLTFNYKQWQWLSSVGKVPYFESTFALNYHWNATKQLGLDLGGKILELDYSPGNEVNPAGQNSSLRDDIVYSLSAGVSYAFSPHFSGSLSYICDLGVNGYDNLPATLGPDYRDFEHQLVSLSLQYKF